MSNKAHLRPHRKKRQASRTSGLILVVLFVALVVLATAMAASGHAMPHGRIIPLYPVDRLYDWSVRSDACHGLSVIAAWWNGPALIAVRLGC
jgi:hypothetical protein